jgi:uncharacterized protein YbjT (DUF2867 family)
MILVVGATSKPGQKLVPLLLEKGYQVRAMTRAPHKLADTQFLGVEVIEGDMRQPDMLLRACEGAEAVVSSVTAPMTMGDNSVRTVDAGGNRSLMESAKRCGVKRFVLVSAYGAAQNHPVDFFRIKHQTESYLKSVEMDYTILRPTAFMEAWCARLGTQVMNGKEVTIFGDGRNPISFISAEDVARFIVFALEDPRLCNQTLTIGGPQNLTFDEVVSTYERLTSKSVNRKYISAFRMKLLSILLATFDETKSRFMAMRHELATSNWRVDMNEMVKHYPISLTKLDEWISRTVKQD